MLWETNQPNVTFVVCLLIELALSQSLSRVSCFSAQRSFTQKLLLSNQTFNDQCSAQPSPIRQLEGWRLFIYCIC